MDPPEPKDPARPTPPVFPPRPPAQPVAAPAAGSVEGFASALAHEINNILTVAAGSLDIALLRLPPDHPELPRLQRSLSALSRLAQLSRELGLLSRRHPPGSIAIPLPDLLTRLLPSLQTVVAAPNPLLLPPTFPVATLRGDPGQIELLLTTLVASARSLLAAPGKFTLTTALDPAEPIALQLELAATPVDLAPNQLGSLFEPYYAASVLRRGTGIGLALPRAIALQHQGDLQARIDPATRTLTLTLVLPASLPAA